MSESPIYPNAEKFAGKTVLVTGGTGFIGSPLVRALSQHCDVVVLSRNKKIKGIHTIHADITRLGDLEKKLKKTDLDLVFHVAGNTVNPHHTTDLDLFSTNSLGTKNLLELSVKKDVEQVVYSSSMEVYGDLTSLPVTEDHPQIPLSFYGMSKWSGEHYCSEFFRHHGLKFTTLRYSYVYGPQLPDFRVISRFIKNVLDNKPLILNNAGKSTTDYIFVKDVVAANILAAFNKKTFSQAFNIGSGVETSVEDLAHHIVKIMGWGTLQHMPEDPDATKRFFFDISKAKRRLGFSPAYSLREGLKEQVKYMTPDRSNKLDRAML